MDNHRISRKKAGDFGAQLQFLERMLDRHLIDEEEHIVPVILKKSALGWTEEEKPRLSVGPVRAMLPKRSTHHANYF